MQERDGLREEVEWEKKLPCRQRTWKEANADDENYSYWHTQGLRSIDELGPGRRQGNHTRYDYPPSQSPFPSTRFTSLPIFFLPTSTAKDISAD